MAIATDLEVTWNGTVDATNKIGLSKPFTELPSDVWADDSAFITAYNNPAAKFTKVSDGYPTCPVKSDNCPWYLTGGIGYSNINHNSDSIYLRSAIICIPDDFVYNTWNGNQGGRIRDNINNFRIVTSLSTEKNGVDVSLTIQDGTVVGAQYLLKETLTGSSSNGGITIGAGTYVLMIVDIYTVDGNYYLNIPYSLPGFVYDTTNNGDGVMGMWAYDSSVNKMFSLSPQIFPTDDGRISITGGAVYNVNTWNRHELPAVEGDANLIFCASYIPWNWYLSLSGNVHYHLLAVSRFGLKFKYNNENYKPIITQGVVTGYTTDMTVPSDIDDWTDISGHNISPTPPPPVPPGPGYDDDPWSGISFSGVGIGGAGAFAKCYYMTSTELANLRSWMNSNNVPEGFDPMQQIIGLSQVPVSLSGDDSTTVQFVNSAAIYDPGVTRVVDSGVNTQISMGTPKKYSLGSVDIVRRMQERGEPYLDYDCQIELYLPLIGMFSLDTQAVMGRTITAEAVLDPISGTLAAYAYVARDGQNMPIAYGSTTIGVDLPISAQQYSVSRAALKQANAQLGTSLLSSTLSLIAAATAGGKGSGTGAKTATGTTNGLAAAGIREAGADYMKASQAGNVFGDFMQWGRTIRQLSYGNNTAIAGSFGGSTAQWSYPFTPYVKINRPRYEKPSNYNHSQGVPCVQTKTLGSCTGFIQCIGVDVSGITGATDIELQAIQAALTNGVFTGGSS